MENTTIAVTNEIKERIRKRQLHDLLMNEEDTISIEEAISNSKNRWQK